MCIYKQPVVGNGANATCRMLSLERLKVYAIVVSSDYT